MNDKTVDFHVHIIHEELIEIAADKVVVTGFGARKPAPRSPGSRRDAIFRLMLEPSFHVGAMDERHADIHVLATSTVLQGTAWADPESDLRYCRMMNDRTAEWVRHAPQRFVGSMVLPLQDPRASLDEMTRCVDRHGFKVVHAPASVKGAYLGDGYFDEYWSAASGLGVLTYIHPEGVSDPWFQDFGLWNSIGQPIEEVKVMSSLIYSGTFDRFSNLQIVVSHGGGYLPHYIGRLDRNVSNMPDTIRNIRRIPSEYLKMFYYDTCVYDSATLNRLASVVGVDRLVLGSDFPFGDSDPRTVVTQSRLSDDEKRAVIGHNAMSLLKKVCAA
jgi:aminocarboxymuconate-semialdehyde decarboxylase